ncbi:MAG TPA: bifunctional (p)ppGpp synthetase/guanosine-3',5'-bis(diphosphate) 3'-pyrophosphohydrolase, partial [Tissierellaceae bacterium]
MLDKLIKKVESYNPNVDKELLTKAYNFGKKAHEGQYRNSGEEFFIHPYHVALILADLNMDTATIVAGLLHDVVEDTEYTREDIVDLFGEEIAHLVDGVTKLKKIKFRTKQESQAENLRKMILAMSKDIRVIIVKLADRLHNMRTLEYMNPAKKKEKALETLEIYAPLAHRLGISKIKWELEDLSLRYLEPETYYDLVDKVAVNRKQREREIDLIINDLHVELNELGIHNEVNGRPKSFYSIYKKMVNQNKTFEEIFDLTAIRVLVDSIKDCYAVLGAVHTLWKPLPGRFKDYIAMPKPNMYQSLHTTVIGSEGEIFEVQIRTYDMHRTAEYGIAAHWKYKEGGGKAGNDFDSNLTWLRELLEWQNDLKDPKDFMETLKIDFFTDEVFVFTPNGDVINLPMGSTPIDFAYRIHTDVGNSCIGAKVDGRIVPLNYKLRNGNIVEIITSVTSKPSKDWLDIVKSNQAKTKIRQWFKVQDKDVNISKGKQELEKELRKLNIDIDKDIKPKKLLEIS